MNGESLPHAVSAEFLLGATAIEQLPRDGRFEVAVFGRSNVGKSSFINRLANRKNLARASNTPGRTKEINLFEIEVKNLAGRVELVRLADLPGYGFAQVDKSRARGLEELLESYLDGRSECSFGCILLDIRRDPREEELMIQDEFFKKGAPTLVVLTKADKLSKSAQLERVRAVAQSFRLEPDDIIRTGTGIGPAPIWSRILEAAHL